MRAWHIGIVLLLTAGSAAQDATALKYQSRYNVEYNKVNYPQIEAKAAFKSIVKAINEDRYEYLLAQLVDPTFVDARVAEYKALMFPVETLLTEDEEIARELDPLLKKQKIFAKETNEKNRVKVAFGRLLTETKKHFSEDPILVRELRLFARDGEWEEDAEKAVASLKKVTTRKVFLRKLEGRWFMEERQQ